MFCKEEVSIMKSALSHSRFEAPAARLAVNKSTLVIWTAIGLLFAETFSGALRYYFDQAGVSALLYLPKVLCVVLFALELTTLKSHRLFWILLMGLVLSAGLGMLHGATLENPLFSIFVYIPLLFGLVCGEHLEQRRKLLGWAVGLCLAATIIGVYVDSMFSVPWKGYSYSLGDQELTGNMTWAADGIDRPAGFARMSTTAATLTAIFTLYLSAFIRSKVLLLALLALAFATILVTTNKSTAAAFMVTLLVMPLYNQRLLCRVVFTVLVGVGALLPLIGLWTPLDPSLAASGAEGSLVSLYDRMINTWPQLADEVARRGWSWTGGGFGMVGSAVNMFPVDNVKYPAVADSFFMYLWACFGAMGPALYALLLPLLMTLRSKNSWMGRGLLSISLCVVVVGWTTDVLEVPVCGIFLGMAIAHAMRRKAMPSRWLITERRRSNRDDYPDGLQLT